MGRTWILKRRRAEARTVARNACCKRRKRLIRSEAKAAAMEADSKQNELAEEVNYLKSGLQLVRQDHDYQLAQVRSLMADIEKQKEIARRCAVEVDNAMKKVSALEEGCLSQRETIRTLQIQLASANEKLMPHTSGSAVGVKNPDDTLNRIARGMFGGYVNASVRADGNYSSLLDNDLALF